MSWWPTLRQAWQRLRSHAPGAQPPHIPDALWQRTLASYPFLQALPPPEQQLLRPLCAHFLQRKQFTGVHDVVITDDMALAIAAQACVLLLHWGPPAHALRWYDDFVGIVVHPADATAQRTAIDDAGVVHRYEETLMGEAMEGGPVMLSWAAIAPDAPHTHGAVDSATNVVIHEFAHKLDMAWGGADGCPPLPAGFMGHTHAASARAHWAAVWQAAYDDFCEACAAHARFGQTAPWLNAYAAEHPAEFFAVACEAYWVQPAAFAHAHPSLLPLLDALFQRRSWSAAPATP